MLPIVAFSLSIIILGAYHVSRTRIRPTPSSDMVDNPSRDKLVAEAKALIAPVDPQQSMEGWRNLVKRGERCIDMFLPKRDVDFVGFMQSVTLCTLLAGFYDVDPEFLSPLDIAFMTNALNHHSDRAFGPPDAGELSAMTRCIYRWINEEHTSRALEIILLAYQSMWHLAAVTLTYVNGDQHMRNAFLDFSENPTERQFRAYKVKEAKPSVEAIVKEVLLLHPPTYQTAPKSRLFWWKQLLYSPVETGDTHPETFNAMRFHPKQSKAHRVLSFAYDGLSEEWSLMVTALIVAKVIDNVDDVRFILTGNASDPSAVRDMRTCWNGWTIRKKEKDHLFPSPSSPPPPYLNLIF